MKKKNKYKRKPVLAGRWTKHELPTFPKPIPKDRIWWTGPLTYDNSVLTGQIWDSTCGRYRVYRVKSVHADVVEDFRFAGAFFREIPDHTKGGYFDSIEMDKANRVRYRRSLEEVLDVIESFHVKTVKVPVEETNREDMVIKARGAGLTGEGRYQPRSTVELESDSTTSPSHKPKGTPKTGSTPRPRSRNGQTVASIVLDALKGASAKKPVQRSELEKLAMAAFPEIEPEKVRSNVYKQLVYHLRKKGYDIGKTEDGRYWMKG